MSLVGAHIAGIPVEETLMSFGPVLLMVLGAAAASTATRWRRARTRLRALRGAVGRIRRRPGSG
ncbi:MAG: hypothetical protein JST59_26305 [Actinobacteria bacterium]|nr:hypothetical protein [Actinomycetota bacterium]